MKAKSNFSTLVAETTAKGSLALFAGIGIFLAGFITWSAAGAVSAIIDLFA
jgi:hypothetical protein